MSLIKSRNTKLETSFLKLLSSSAYPKGYRYQKHYTRLLGKPDIVFIGEKVVVFLDGDFWHGYNLRVKGKKVPKKYWLPKIKRNIKRDRAVSSSLRKSGWKVLRFWEHEIQKNPAKAIRKIEKTLYERKNKNHSSSLL